MEAQAMIRLLMALVGDDTGATAMDYTLTAALIAVASAKLLSL